MTEHKITLTQVGEPGRTEIVKGLIFEDKMRIRTQRRLETHFKLPMSRIFPGTITRKNPTTQAEEIETWPGVNFEFLDNLIPLMTILGMQADDTLTQEKVEGLFDNLDVPISQVADNLCAYFVRIKEATGKVDEVTKNG